MRGTFEPLENRQLMSAGITAVTLINADTGKDIGPVTKGMTLDLATLPTHNLNVRADVTSDTESVKFGYDAKRSYHTENYFPFAFAGDDYQKSGRYYNWTPTLGAHKLRVTPYTLDKAGGTAGSAVVLPFTVVDSTPPDPEPNPDPQPDPDPQPNPDPGPGPIDDGITPPVLPGTWDLLFHDEFSSLPTTPTWVPKLWGTTHFDGEIQNYTPNNVTVSGGVLSLTAKKQSSSGYPYTSGLINSGGDFATGGDNLPGFSFKYGYVEARMKLTTGSGLWPAFWMMPTPDANGNYHDGNGEIDIMEQVGTDPTRTEGHLHHDGERGKSYDTGVDLSESFHTYAIDWQADHLTWYFDGKPFYTTTNSVPNVAMYLIFNLAVGDSGSWPGAPDSGTSFPSSFQVDWVRVWQ